MKKMIKMTAEGAGQKAEGAGQTAEGAGQTAEGAGQTAEGAGQTAEGAGQTAEGAGQTAEGAGQTASWRKYIDPVTIYPVDFNIPENPVQVSPRDGLIPVPVPPFQIEDFENFTTSLIMMDPLNLRELQALFVEVQHSIGNTERNRVRLEILPSPKRNFRILLDDNFNVTVFEDTRFYNVLIVRATSTHLFHIFKASTCLIRLCLLPTESIAKRPAKISLPLCINYDCCFSRPLRLLSQFRGSLVFVLKKDSRKTYPSEELYEFFEEKNGSTEPKYRPCRSCARAVMKVVQYFQHSASTLKKSTSAQDINTGVENNENSDKFQASQTTKTD